MKARDGIHRVTVKFFGVVLKCEGHYYKGFAGSYMEPPEPALFEFTYVKHCDEDVYGLLGEDNLRELEQMCIRELNEAYA